MKYMLVIYIRIKDQIIKELKLGKLSTIQFTEN
jgi:hypothetical protein